MPAAPAKPATTPIPVQLSAAEFTQFILPHLSMPRRGPKCKLGYHCIFNLILWLLYTGMQWKGLPVPQDAQGKPAIHYTTVYKVFAMIDNNGYVLAPLPVAPVNEADTVLLPAGLKGLKRVAKCAGLELGGAYLKLDGGFDSQA